MRAGFLKLRAVAAIAVLATAWSGLARAGGVWEQLAPMPTPRQEVAVAALRGLVFVAGGFDDTRQPSDVVEVYDPSRDAWTPAPPLPIRTEHSVAAVAAGALYVLGGSTNRVFRFRPETDTEPSGWVEVAPMRLRHGGSPAVGTIGEKIYVAGGSGEMRGDETEVYDPSTNSWSDAAPMPTPRNHVGSAVIGGRLFVVAGRGSAGASTALEVYDPVGDRWTMLSPLPTGRSGVAAAAVGSRLYVFGGETPGIFEDVEVFDTRSGTWTALDPMPTPRHGIGAAVVDGRVLIPGGATSEGFAATSVNEAFRPDPEPGPVVLGASISRKVLTVAGTGFADGARILVDGVAYKTKNVVDAPATMLTSKRAAKRIRKGQTVRLAVENPDGARSPEFEFVR